MLLSDSELSAMRADVARTLPQSAVIYSPSYANDGAGGVTLTLTNAGTVACRLDPLSKSQRSAVVAGQEALTLSYQATFPHDTTLAIDYQVIIEGNTYQIVQLDAGHGWKVSTRALLAEVT